MFGLEFGSLLAIGVGFTLMVIMVFLTVHLYVKCGPNEAMIISGLYAGTGGGQGFKIIVGGGAVALPIMQQVNRISLEVRKVTAKSQTPMITQDGVPVQIEVSIQVKVKGDELSIATAAEQLLGKSGEEIDSIVSGIILSAMRVEVSNTSLAQMKKGFSLASPSLEDKLVIPLLNMGMVCSSLTVDELSEPVLVANPRSDETSLLTSGYVRNDLQQTSAAAQNDLPRTAASLQNDLQQSIAEELAVAEASRLKLISEYEQAMPVLEKEVGEQSIVFKDYLLRYATILAAGDDYLSREKAEQLRDRAKKIQPAGLANVLP